MRTTAWVVAIIAGVLTAGESHADETLTLEGAIPRLILDDKPNQKWTILGDLFSFEVENSTAGTVPFKILPAAPAGSLFIGEKNGPAVGIGTVDPQNCLHIVRDGGGGLRLERGAPAAKRIWDLNVDGDYFQLHDGKTGGTPVWVETGAPHFTLVLDRDGHVGLGTQFPDANSKMEIRSGLTNGLLMKRADANAHYLRVENTFSAFRCGVQGNGDAQFGALTPNKGLNLLAGGTGKVAINASGQISFGSTPPAFTTHALVHTSGARLTAAGVWTDASSRTFKQDIEPITSAEARDTVRALQPVGYRYKNELDERYVGFIAEDVPELVATRDRKALAPMDITAVLTKVVQDQDRELVEQKRINAELSDRLLKLEQQLVRRAATEPNGAQ